MARNHDNFKPKRSRRSGRKSLRLVQNNLAVLKKFLVLLLFIPFVSFSQVSSWRSNPPSRVQTGPSIQGQRSDVSMWRNTNPREFNRPQPTRPGSNIIVTDPWMNWGWGRWGLWGAPAFGWNFWNPYWYYNDWGYRQPGRIYVYENGKRDTIRGKKPIYNFGIQKSTDKQIGGFFAVGNKAYFITEFNSTYEKDNSLFFPHGNINKVDFPLVDDYVRIQTFYAGVGKRFKRTGVHMMIGTVDERARYRGKDKLGFITFPKYHTTNITAKVGIMHDLKNTTIKLDHDPFTRTTTVGLGLNF